MSAFQRFQTKTTKERKKKMCHDFERDISFYFFNKSDEPARCSTHLYVVRIKDYETVPTVNGAINTEEKIYDDKYEQKTFSS